MTEGTGCAGISVEEIGEKIDVTRLNECAIPVW